ncbi:MAG: diguanylate cyclase [Clostridia bacterium]|nr:diguanylate cyclase [Clostridia bacterium]
MKLNIRVKTILMIVAFCLTLATASVILSGRTIVNIAVDYYKDKASTTAATAAKVIDKTQYLHLRQLTEEIYHKTEPKVSSEEWQSEAFKAYTDHFTPVTEEKEYDELLSYLRELTDSFKVDCIYLGFVDTYAEQIVYVIDSDTSEGQCLPGCIDPFYSEDGRVLEDPAYGFPPFLTNTDAFGHLITAGSPIIDDENNVLGYAFVDISMLNINRESQIFVLELTGLLLVLIVLICVISMFIVNRILIHPLRQLSDTALNFFNGQTLADGYHQSFAKLHIKNKDEIGALATSMTKMEEDINNHILRLNKATDDLSESQTIAAQMTKLANIDPLTGVKSKTAYDSAIKLLDELAASGNPAFGLAMVDLNDLKGTNDTYGHEHGDIAIKTLSSLICKVFKHSPVYRIGGDEFMVILKNEDYQNIDALVAEFNEKLEAKQKDPSLKPWEKSMAAIGYAKFDPQTDRTCQDVFRRADSNMYERKVHMKHRGS